MNKIELKNNASTFGFLLLISNIAFDFSSGLVSGFGLQNPDFIALNELTWFVRVKNWRFLTDLLQFLRLHLSRGKSVKNINRYLTEKCCNINGTLLGQKLDVFELIFYHFSGCIYLLAKGQPIFYRSSSSRKLYDARLSWTGGWSG